DNAPVGIDIQNMEQLKKPISGHFFTENENSYISANGLQGFYEVWTRKEAYVKMLGTGFSTPISSFDVFDERDVSFNTQVNESYMITVCSRNELGKKVEFERVEIEDLEA
nr:4'-phosphopantetheinyl transferase superfamily protein [Eubacterium sp.]